MYVLARDTTAVSEGQDVGGAARALTQYHRYVALERFVSVSDGVSATLDHHQHHVLPTFCST